MADDLETPAGEVLQGLRQLLDGRASDLLFGLGSLAVGIGLIFYERYFLKKLKRVSYL